MAQPGRVGRLRRPRHHGSSRTTSFSGVPVWSRFTETTSLLLNWMALGALLAILFRLSSTFNLIANTQRELRRAIYHLGERRAAELGVSNAFAEHVTALVSRSAYERASAASTIGDDDLTHLPL
jgi:hypothetical protein